MSQETVWTILDRLAAEDDTSAPSVYLDHRRPARPPSIGEAHRAMRLHRTCGRGDCGRKAASWQVLVDAGRLVPRPENRL